MYDAIRELGYHPNLAARRLASKRNNVVGITIAHTPDVVFAFPYFMELMQGIAQVVTREGFHLILSTFSGSSEHDPDGLQLALEGLIDGLILTSVQVEDRRIDLLEKAGIPFVLTAMPAGKRFKAVEVDNVDGAVQATRYLAQLGHQRIAFINGNPTYLTSLARLEGYRRGLESVGLPFDSALVVEGDFTQAGGYAAGRRLLRAAQRPTAIFCASDLAAIGAMKAIREAGLEVPDDVSVVGFDDIAAAALAEPPLTTVRQPVQQVGATAAEMLIRLIQGHRLARNQVVLPVELVVRSSCKALQ
ncbi:MAG TPA: LacI family transcriptional regulator [Firmicutes bacterium]|nr:LacI family transcriptional regulator [Bacillota bacterium]